mgnify:CR=1 FL=1
MILNKATDSHDINESYALEQSQERLLGEGSFGKVYLGYDKVNGSKVAVKVL